MKENILVGYVFDLDNNNIRIKLPYKKLLNFFETKNAKLNLNSFLIIKNDETNFTCLLINSMKDNFKQQFERLEWSNNDIIIACTYFGNYDVLTNKFNLSLKKWPLINAEVFIPSLEILNKITSLNSKYKMMIGKMDFDNSIDVYADPDILFGKHLGIFGNTGSGKSRTVGSLLEGIKTRIFMNNEVKEGLSPKIITIDPHNEYYDILKGSINYDVYDDNNQIFSVPWALEDYGLDSTEFVGILGLGATSSSYIKKFYNENKAEQRTFDKIYNNLENAPGQHKTYVSSDVKKIDALKNSKLLNIIESKTNNSILDFLNDRTKEMLNLKLSADNDSQNFLFLLITKTIYKWIINSERGKRHLILVIDESHRYVNNTNSDIFDYVSKYINLLIREGRKHNFSMIIASQSPSDIPKTLISQCNNFILHKIINKFDYDAISRIISNEGSHLIHALKTLSPQVALVCGEAFSAPILTKIETCNKLTIEPMGVVESWDNSK